MRLLILLLTFLNQGLPTISIGNVFVKQWGLCMSYVLCLSVSTNYKKIMGSLGVLIVLLTFKIHECK